MKRINFIVFLIICFFLLIFDIYKAGHTSFTHDESFTYNNYVNMGFFDILSFKHPFPNNHILNTVMVKLFEMLFGASELSLRFPNILCHLLYMLFTYKFFSRYCSRLFVPFFILVNFNPFLIDFFSLARGYGIAIGLMSAGLYYYARYIESGFPKFQTFSMTGICLASIANFALLNVLLVLILVHNFFELLLVEKSNRKTFWQVNKINLLILICFGIVMYEPLRRIIISRMWDFGGTQGIWQDTVSSLISSTAYNASYDSPLIIFLKFFVIAFSLFSIIAMVSILKGRKPFGLNQKLVLFFGLMLFLTIFSTILQYFILHTPYLAGRFALFLFPLFIVNSCLLIYYFYQKSKTLTVISAFSIAALFFAHTLNSLNTTFYQEWKYDRNTKLMLSILEKEKFNSNFRQIQLGITWLFEPTINFYKKTQHLDWLIEVDRNGLKQGDDFYYLNEDDDNKIPQANKIVVFEFNEPPSFLVKHIDSMKF